MKFFTIICLFFGLITFVISKDLKGCKIDDHFFAIGETYAPEGKCHEATCDDIDSFHLKGCPTSAVVNLEKYDLIPEDNTKIFPECCEQYKKKTEI